MSLTYIISFLLAISYELIVVGVMLRIIMKRPSTAVALAWLVVVATIPIVGMAAYFLIGERRLSIQRNQRVKDVFRSREHFQERAVPGHLSEIDWTLHSESVRGLDRLGTKLTSFPAVASSEYTLYSEAEIILNKITQDIDRATKSIFMEFYIWNEGGAADLVTDALIRAQGRGVRCKLLIDALGAGTWWKSEQPDQLQSAGVELIRALPVGLLRTFTARGDLRLHRKIVLIDAKIVWTGSMNLVDPDYFKQSYDVGNWVDAMARLEGAAVACLGATILGDISVETDESIRELLTVAPLETITSKGDVTLQVVPTGPGETADGLLQMLLALIASAQKSLVLTTPYFVPDDSLHRALISAASRGVAVTLILPEKVDSFITRYASLSYYSDLLASGIKIQLYTHGLLHTKSITVDDEISMFGTVNLDMRSLWLNYEVSLFVYNKRFTSDLRILQDQYIEDSTEVDLHDWEQRPYMQKFLENLMRLASPLL